MSHVWRAVAGCHRPQETCLPPQLLAARPSSGGCPGNPKSNSPCVPPLTLQIGDHRLMLVLEFGEALRFLLLFHEVGGELGYSVFQQLLLLGCEGGSGLKVS